MSINEINAIPELAGLEINEATSAADLDLLGVFDGIVDLFLTQ